MPWVPQVLPIQIFVIGNLALPALPGEPTTVTGYRLADTVEGEIEKLGVDTISVVGYANAYLGYITTYEEYRAQCYEGGNTLFGPWTFAGYQTRFASLLKYFEHQKTLVPQQTGEVPIRVSCEELPPPPRIFGLVTSWFGYLGSCHFTCLNQ